MNFSSALEALKEGKKVRRTLWEDNSYLLLGTKEQYGKELFIFCSECYNRKYSECVSIVLISDLLADDWEIIEDIPDVKLQRSTDTSETGGVNNES